MSTPPVKACEVKIDGSWRAISLKEVRLLPPELIKRCPLCHGRVDIVGVYSAQAHLTVSHQRSHDGCPFSPRHYRGVPKRHPEAVE